MRSKLAIEFKTELNAKRVYIALCNLSQTSYQIYDLDILNGRTIAFNWYIWENIIYTLRKATTTKSFKSVSRILEYFPNNKKLIDLEYNHDNLDHEELLPFLGNLVSKRFPDKNTDPVYIWSFATNFDLTPYLVINVCNFAETLSSRVSTKVIQKMSYLSTLQLDFELITTNSNLELLRKSFTTKYFEAELAKITKFKTIYKLTVPNLFRRNNEVIDKYIRLDIEKFYKSFISEKPVNFKFNYAQ